MIYFMVGEGMGIQLFGNCTSIRSCQDCNDRQHEAAEMEASDLCFKEGHLGSWTNDIERVCSVGGTASVTFLFIDSLPKVMSLSGFSKLVKVVKKKNPQESKKEELKEEEQEFEFTLPAAFESQLKR